MKKTSKKCKAKIFRAISRILDVRTRNPFEVENSGVVVVVRDIITHYVRVYFVSFMIL